MNIDADVLQTIKAISQAKSQSLGKTISEGLRQSFEAEEEIQLTPPTEDYPFCTFPATGRTIDPEDIKRELAEEGVAKHLELVEEAKKARTAQRQTV